MSFSSGQLSPLVRISPRLICALLILLSTACAYAGVIRGTVTDTTGATSFYLDGKEISAHPLAQSTITQ